MGVVCLVRGAHTSQQTATNLYPAMATSLRCSYLLAVVVAAVLFGVCSAQSQQYHPQPNVLTGLNHQAVGATIHLRPEVWVNASMAQYAQQIAAQFPEIVLSINS